MPHSGKPVPHDSARGHATGTAPYIADLPALAGELWVDYVPSPLPNGLLRRVDTDEALRVSGVVAILTAADIPGRNRFGSIICDEPFLPSDRVSYTGQPVAIIAAESREAARRARALVRLDIAAEPPVLTIEEACAAGLFIGPRRRIARGDAAAAIASAPHRLEGEFRSGGQEQFYLESQAAIAIPGEQGQMVVHSSTQNPTEIQAVVAEALGLGMHEVVCICRRMGGGFGGKETQAAIPAVMAALVARHTGRPARVVWSKDDDMKTTGKRHEFRTRYRVGFDDDGRVLGLSIEFHSNGGAFADLSTAIMERAMLHADNAYYLPHVEITGQVCRTHLPPNTAFRGFGGPQGVAAIETILEDIAATLGRDALAVRRVNLYGVSERNTTPYGQTVEGNLLPRIFDELERTSDYATRRRAVQQFNATSRTHLRGLAMTAVKFGISFTTKFLNQGNALVSVLMDGTVQVSTGATEMGQGVNTKIRQLVADEFGLPLEAVVVLPTSTERNINTSPTAASAGADLNGTAAVRACAEIRGRMAECAARHFEAAGGPSADPAQVRFADGAVFDVRNPDQRLDFSELAGICRRERVDLGARGFYATPLAGFDRESGQGAPFLYYTTGAAVAEVLVDRFTGDLTVERVDLLMDIGRMINPGVDRGQVIGGFIQGMGWVTTEQLVYGARGELLSHSPTTYKIPSIGDVPRIFRVAVLDNDLNKRNIFSSKAVGEPPLLLAVCVFEAVKNALTYAAAGRPVPLFIPATNEAILMALDEAAKSRNAPKESGVAVESPVGVP
ncbi:MAG: xanthine dehydrogenase molybdopterin binding subunit [Candidatus Sumerlaeaceae bacterium]|nr:xanthine dehydrogenase molybdopterin binding subunit [Candidatus Sumerlaeaceae bacterium]